MQQEDSTTENVSENKPRSADSINARREARRKRILEGSNSRLSKIVGRDYKEEPVVIGKMLAVIICLLYIMNSKYLNKL